MTQSDMVLSRSHTFPPAALVQLRRDKKKNAAEFKSNGSELQQPEPAADSIKNALHKTVQR